MPDRTDIAYRYDGTLPGFLCCVFESYEKKEMPDLILGPDDGRVSFFETREIRTDPARAERVLRSIPARISAEALQLVERTMLTCLPGRERHLLAFLRLGYRVGAGVVDMRYHDAVGPIVNAVLHMEREAHLYTGFVRFTQNAGVLAAVIEPKNRVLSLIADHFLDRFHNESFIIFDRTHREALVAQRGRGQIVPLEALELPEPDDAERAVRALWRRFHAAVGIAQRKNYRCQRTHLPMRYRRVMTEFTTDLARAGKRPALPPPRLGE
jgi:probable DNA metabolism protein